MATCSIKSPKNIDLFLNSILTNNLKEAECLLNAYPEISNIICMDGLQPIFFCIRNGVSEIFKQLLDKMELNEDLIKNIYNLILEKKQVNMLKIFMEKFKINKDDDCLNEVAKKMLEEKNDNSN